MQTGESWPVPDVDVEEIATVLGVDPGVVSFGPLKPEPGGDMVSDNVRLGPGRPTPESNEVTWENRHLYRDDIEIGSVDYWTCHTCRRVLLGEIGLIETEQRRGTGTRVLALLRQQLPGYSWCTTATKIGSEPFWARIRQAHPGEYYDFSDGGAKYGRSCAHIEQVT